MICLLCERSGQHSNHEVTLPSSAIEVAKERTNTWIAQIETWKVEWTKRVIKARAEEQSFHVLLHQLSKLESSLKLASETEGPEFLRWFSECTEFTEDKKFPFFPISKSVFHSFWSYAFNASTANNSLALQATSRGAWGHSKEFPTMNTFSLEFRVTNPGWLSFGIGTTEGFVPGFTRAHVKSFAFYYSIVYGSVNEQPGYSKCPPDAPIEIVFKFSRRKLTFSVDGKEQPGSWDLPESVQIYADMYQPQTKVELIQILNE